MPCSRRKRMHTSSEEKRLEREEAVGNIGKEKEEERVAHIQKGVPYTKVQPAIGLDEPVHSWLGLPLKEVSLLLCEETSIQPVQGKSGCNEGVSAVMAAEEILLLLKDDMIMATTHFQTTGKITCWCLEQVRISIPDRCEGSIKRRHHTKTWRQLFEDLFPREGMALEPYLKPPRWSKIGYLRPYLNQCALISNGGNEFPAGYAEEFDKELWRLFSDLDCAVRPLIRSRFVERGSKGIYIDLPEVQL
ncbi:hypothetical protein BJ684DRAFT_16806 [Piptocephalis cylindrospora]|uniref:Uncharacterized protein n=1 Tax=Piptocephalis cylindrospora TaxID=1907219 RepID=A0A4P9Y1W5_9FUNG|nr:hypothetical protein BJ684DRAFT_16806 [Piptocephalis cylindrospora]|eukprot:RKP12743.1 hypothetical protein BJ684DRAFT_16806 [Piptocephalis cylindrospora]